MQKQSLRKNIMCIKMYFGINKNYNRCLILGVFSVMVEGLIMCLAQCITVVYRRLESKARIFSPSDCDGYLLDVAQNICCEWQLFTGSILLPVMCESVLFDF